MTDEKILEKPVGWLEPDLEGLQSFLIKLSKHKLSPQKSSIYISEGDGIYTGKLFSSFIAEGINPSALVMDCGMDTLCLFIGMFMTGGVDLSSLATPGQNLTLDWFIQDGPESHVGDLTKAVDPTPRVEKRRRPRTDFEKKNQGPKLKYSM